MNPKEAFPHHTPDFYIDDSRLDVGIKAFANIVFDFDKAKLNKSMQQTAVIENQMDIMNCQPKIFIWERPSFFRTDSFDSLCKNS